MWMMFLVIKQSISVLLKEMILLLFRQPQTQREKGMLGYLQETRRRWRCPMTAPHWPGNPWRLSPPPSPPGTSRIDRNQFIFYDYLLTYTLVLWKRHLKHFLIWYLSFFWDERVMVSWEIRENYINTKSISTIPFGCLLNLGFKINVSSRQETNCGILNDRSYCNFIL